jgi:PAS domain S-box-containing protein
VLRGDESAKAQYAVGDEVGDHVHLLQFYENDSFLVDTVSRFIGPALENGDAVVVIATQPHRDGLGEQLEARAHDLASARAQGRYLCLDAAETLAKFMVNGWPDETRFAEVVGDVIARAAADHRRVRAFGEMVGVLWAQGQRDAAIRLEQLWNDLAGRLPFSLLCAYRLAEFGSEADGPPFRRICGEHSHVFPAESYAGLDSAEERLRAIAQLQQKGRALDHEIALRKKAEQTLTAQREHTDQLQTWLAAIVESSDDAVIGKTLDGIVTSWNAAAERIFGYTADEMIGSSISRLLPHDRQEELSAILAAIRRGDRVEHFETERVRKDGQRIHVSLTVSPIKDAQGHLIGASKVARDVSERKRAETAKDEFLAMLGHELRNPLAAVQSALTAARLDPSRREQALDIARRQAMQLQRLVDDLLDVARVTRGKIQLNKERIFLTSVVECALESARTEIEDRGHSVSISLPADIRVDVDAGRMEQVLVNLLMNAAKYTLPGGRIEIIAEGGDDEIVLSVRDNGMGINAELLPHVFDLFSQADRSLDRSQGGLGLGLALVRRIVELHGGRVEARSDGCGKGAEFVVRLPAPLGPEPTPLEAAPDAGGAGQRTVKARVLIVEDNVDAAESLAMLLHVLGHRVDVAHDGLAALAAMEQTRPDVMLVDIGLPGIDGFEVARRARRLPVGAQTLLVALTGYGQDSDKEQARAAGFDHHLTKPIEIDALKELVARLDRSAPQLHQLRTVH